MGNFVTPATSVPPSAAFLMTSLLPLPAELCPDLRRIRKKTADTASARIGELGVVSRSQDSNRVRQGSVPWEGLKKSCITCGEFCMAEN